jgi:hypothetical protein
MTFDSLEDGPGSGSASIGAISPAVAAPEGPPSSSVGLGTSAPAPIVEQNMAMPNFSVLRARAEFPPFFAPLRFFLCLFFHAFELKFLFFVVLIRGMETDE